MSDDDRFDGVRDAAVEVIESLKRLIDATEEVVRDPAAFAQAVDGGKSVVEAFLGGFVDEVRGDPEGDVAPSDTATAESDESADES